MSDMETPQDKPRGLTPEQLAEARKAYESGEPMASVARRLNIRRPTLIDARDRDRDKGDPWIVQPRVQVSPTDVRAIEARATNKVIDIASRKAVEVAVDNGTIDHLAEALRQQALVSGKLMAGLNKVLDKFNSAEGIVPGPTQSIADVLNSLSNATKNVFAAVREVAGLRPGIPSAGSDADEGLTIEERVIEPKKLDVDANGRAIATG